MSSDRTSGQQLRVRGTEVLAYSMYKCALISFSHHVHAVSTERHYPRLYRGYLSRLLPAAGQQL